MVECHGFENC